MSLKFIFFSLLSFIVKSKSAHVQKVAVVTGSDKGLGYEIAEALCQDFVGIVYITARDSNRSLTNIKYLKRLDYSRSEPVYHYLDVTDKHSIQVFADFIKKKHGGIDLLINNAALGLNVLFSNEKSSFYDRAKAVFAVNYYGLLDVCHALFPLLRPHARVVNLSCKYGCLNRIPRQNIRARFLEADMTEGKISSLMGDYLLSLQKEKSAEDGWGDCPYTISKIGVTALTILHQHQFLLDPREDIIINAVHPGDLQTGCSHYAGEISAKEGVGVVLYCALLPKNWDSPKGDLVWHYKRPVNWVQCPVMDDIDYEMIS